MAELKGTNVASGLVPFTDLDKYPTHYSQYGKGGYRTVNTINERDAIPEERREEGMLCYVIEDDSGIHTYKLTKEDNKWKWQKFKMESAGIPILDKEELEKLEGDVVDKYIFIPSENDLTGEIKNNTYTTQSNGSYLDILFQSIRQLQIEVAKMRNAFKYGIYSYTGTNTAMSGIVSDEIEMPEDEPLWAVEPDMLSLITGSEVSINSDVNNLLPLDNIIVSEGKLVINGEVEWFDYEDLVKNTEDSKLFIYLTTTNLNININLISKEGDKELNIDISDILKNTITLSKYSILVVISRKIEDLGGKNYIWISVGNPKTNISLVEGYLNTSDNSLKTSLIESDNYYTINTIKLTNLDLYQLDFYSKYQEFTKEVMPSKPSDQDYKYRVAHLTIRSVKNKEILESIKEQLPDNELIFEEAAKKLWIKNNNNLYAIGATGTGGDSGGGSFDDTMTQEELIEKLKDLGIVCEGNENNGYEISLSAISDITFIHQASGKQFKFEVNSEGSLVSTELPDITLADRINTLSTTQYKIDESNLTPNIRGFVSRLLLGENKQIFTEAKSDIKLKADRIKIGAFYAPKLGDTVFGCSHAYIELENTLNQDFPLNGCYLHYLHPIYNSENNFSGYVVEHLALEGILPAGSTFLIRGKQYSDKINNPNTFINVDSFDMEWFVDGSAIDLTMNSTDSYGFALTYGQPNLTYDSQLQTSNSGEIYATDKVSCLYPYYFIDSIPINAHVNDNSPWGPNYVTIKSNTIVKNTFELDPAKQAFQGLTTYDSSRTRLANIGNDIMYLNLDKEEISFPHSEEKYPISKFTPKSSKLKKNVITDKTNFNLEKPNAVNCSFGINIYTTRCFNWVSGGEFDEYVWIKKDNDWLKFESYKIISESLIENFSLPRRKEFPAEINNCVYARLIGDFPGCSIHYTSHKCIIDIVNSPVSSPTTYTYIVGRAKEDGTPDFDHCCSEHTFTLFPESYTPRIYQTTDQQGFHWIEYQAWSAAANVLSDKITSETSSENIIPILINTGDMTQNGTRINEWLDYFNGGESLFNHLEHMAVVGNNDLCGTDPSILGTGDDNGKSNAYFFHVFTCYEIFGLTSPNPVSTNNSNFDGKIYPVIKLPNGNYRYIPSLYYFESTNYRFVMCHSEITYINCQSWYGLDVSSTTSSGNIVDRTFNIYTGWGVPKDSINAWDEYNNNFVSVYTMIWNILKDAENKSKEVIVGCHEMPFTVITLLCIGDSAKGYSRSVNEGNKSLVGCHMNQLTVQDTKSLYWFSRLLEYFKVKLVLGGHKHTYACTLPVREYYFYDPSGSGDSKVYNKNSAKDGPMVMNETLENDDVYWTSGENNTSKFPLLYDCDDLEKGSIPDAGKFWPYTDANVLDSSQKYKENCVTYFMCQATGYKQTSNKELPTNFQSFSGLIPQTTSAGKADNNQKYPMYLVVKLNNDNYEIKLSRISGIMDSNYKFTQSAYGKSNLIEQWATKDAVGNVEAQSGKYCNWSNTEKTIVIVKK